MKSVFNQKEIDRVAWDTFNYSCPTEQMRMQIAMVLALENSQKCIERCEELLNSFKIRSEIHVPEEEFNKATQK